VEFQYAFHRYCTIFGDKNLYMLQVIVHAILLILKICMTCCLFGTCGTLEQHGFARNKIWIVDEEAPPLSNGDNNNKACVDLLLKPCDDDCWPHMYNNNSTTKSCSPKQVGVGYG
jgi:hypothetical protein